MDPWFIDRLPREAIGKDFRVIADEGGYAEMIQDLIRQLRSSYQAVLGVYAQRDFTKLMLRITVNRDTFATNGAEYRFDGAVGELLDPDGQPTDEYVTILLGIDPSITQKGQTVGVLRMEPIRSVPEAI